MSFFTRFRRRWIAAFVVAALAFAPAELLCRVHFQAETQTLDLAKLPQLSAFNSPVLVLVVEHKALPVETGALLPARIAVAGAPPPPLTVLYSRFLI